MKWPLGLLLPALITVCWAQKAATPPATYVGSETCQTCHEDYFKAFADNPHHAVETDAKRGWKDKACEACHGPGSAHAESADPGAIRNPAKLAAEQSSKVCLTCHLNWPTHIGRVRGPHANNQVPCVTCHVIHKPPGIRTAASINEQCAGCHLTVWAQFQRPYKHPVPEGGMSCVDCHNPHGTFQPASIRLVFGNEPACVKCHGDKRGPFVFEHAPMRLEGCYTCHEPHGSANPRMLTRAEERFVCLECHANVGAPGAITNPGGFLGSVPPAFHDLRSPIFQNCAVCHVKIHGSNVDRGLRR